MQKHNHIKALFFLGIFSLILMHQVVPHLHHQHDVAHTHKAFTDSDNHGHHHDVPEKESSNIGFLDLFLEAHMHSLVSNEIVITHEISVKKINLKKDVKTAISNNHFSVSTNYQEAEKVTLYHPPNNYFKPYLFCLDSRGPPSLG